MLLKYRARLPYDVWRKVCMHYMFVVERMLPAEDANSVNKDQSIAQKPSGAADVSTRESVLGDLSLSENVNGRDVLHENPEPHLGYMSAQCHTWTADNAIVPAPAAGEGSEMMEWALVSAGKVALQQVVHGLLHRLLHQATASVRCMHATC